MSFWTYAGTTPKLKDRFVVKIGGTINVFVKSVDKPTLSFDNKEYKMINHHFKYPGLPKWNTIKMTFVDTTDNVGNYQDQEGAQVVQFLSILEDAGYVNPSGKYLNASRGMSTEPVDSVSKNRSIQALGDIQIQQIGPWTPGGSDKKVKVVEEWKLINPIIKSISFGSLAYGEDGAVEYTLELDYDYAEYSAGHNIQGSG
tara:strand:+ start:1413 stop:2012 length:600 start_codon:yes stop_codon:yes gene_type:complete